MCPMEPPMPKDSSILPRLKKYAEISHEIDSRARTLGSLVEGLQLGVVDGFRPYINPKKNIDRLLGFYATLMSAKKSGEEERLKVEEVFGTSEEGFLPRDLKVLQEKDVIGSVQKLIGARDSLKEYEGVRMVGIEVGLQSEFIKKALAGIEESFFTSLRRVPEYGPELQEFAGFLLSATDRRRFIGRYTDTVYSRLGFDDIGMDSKLLLERTSNLSRFLLEVVEMNNNVLGAENSEVTNTGLLKMFVIGLKRAIADNLMKMEKEEDVGNVPFLMALVERLGYSGDTRIGVVEELFVFKDSIYKIVSNCISRYLEELDMLMEPDGQREAEGLCLKIVDVLDALYDHKSVAEVFVQAYGKDFGVRTVDEMVTKLGSVTGEKVLFLAETLKGIPKSMYIMNNMDLLRHHLRDVEGVSTERMIAVNLEDALGVWRAEIAKRKEEDITVFLDRNVESQSRYRLPSELQKKLSEGIWKLVDDALRQKRYTGSMDKLRNSIARLYSGA